MADVIALTTITGVLVSIGLPLRLRLIAFEAFVPVLQVQLASIVVLIHSRS